MFNENTPSLLWLGAGEIAQRAEPSLSAMGMDTCFVSRSLRRSFDSSVVSNADLNDYAQALKVARHRPSYVVASFSPKGRREEDYNQAYLNSLKNILRAFSQLQHAPRLMVFVSSTSVYQQSDGIRVDEETEVNPERHNGRVLFECERLLSLQNFPTCALRFSGIYGPNRYHLLKQVAQGVKGSHTWTNRIHVEDCARSIAFLLERALHQESIPTVLLASDDTPVESIQLRVWLAEHMSFVQAPAVINNNVIEIQDVPTDADVSGKRCSNRLLKSLGFEFKYPDYTAGFPDIIKSFEQSEAGSTKVRKRSNLFKP